MAKCWFKIWTVGNGGTPSEHHYVFWYDHSDDKWEMADMVERELGPFGEGTRSVNWEKEEPPKEILLEYIQRLKNRIKNAEQEIKILEKKLTP